jgi:hypothetical protein
VSIDFHFGHLTEFFATQANRASPQTINFGIAWPFHSLQVREIPRATIRAKF